MKKNTKRYHLRAREGGWHTLQRTVLVISLSRLYCQRMPFPAYNSEARDQHCPSKVIAKAPADGDILPAPRGNRKSTGAET